MKLLASNPDTIGDMILRQPLYAAVQAAGHELVLIVRRSVLPAVPYAAPGSRTLVLPEEPYRDDIDQHWDRFAEIFAAARAERPDVLLIAPYRWTRFEERLAAELRQTPDHNLRVVGMNGRLYAGDPWAGRPAPSELAMDVAATVEESQHAVEKDAALAEALLGVRPSLEDPHIGPTPAALEAAQQTLARLDLQPGGYFIACVTGTANVPIKTWQTDRWAAVLAEWSRRYGRRFLLVGLPSERDTARLVRDAMGDAAGAAVEWMEDAFDQLVALTSLSQGYAGHDTGPMHVAAALGKPVLAVFGGGTWPRFLPRVTPSVVVTVGVACAGCGWVCAFETSHCIKDAPVDDVMRAVDDLEAGRITGREARVIEPPAALQARMIAEAANQIRERTRDAGEASARARMLDDAVTRFRAEVSASESARAELEAGAIEREAACATLKARLESTRAEADAVRVELDAARTDTAALREQVERLRQQLASSTSAERPAPRRPRRPLRQILIDLITSSRDYRPWREPRPLPRLTLATSVASFAESAIATIESVLAQAGPHLSFVVIDATAADAGADEATPLPAELRRRIEHAGRVMREPEATDFAGVRAAFEASEADVLGWLEPGRVLEPGAILRIVEAFRDHPRSPAIYFEDTRQADGWRLPPAPRPREEVYSLLQYDAPPPISLFIRRHEYTLLARLDPSLGAAAGWDLAVRYARRYGLHRADGHVACRILPASTDADGAFLSARQKFLATFSRLGRVRCGVIHCAARLAHRLRSMLRRRRLTFAPTIILEPRIGATVVASTRSLISPLTGAAPDRLLFSAKVADASPLAVYYDTAGDAAVVQGSTTDSPGPDAIADATPWRGFRGGCWCNRMLARIPCPLHRRPDPADLDAQRTARMLTRCLGTQATAPHILVAGDDAEPRAAELSAATRAKVTAHADADAAFMHFPDDQTFAAIVLHGLERSADPVRTLRRLRLLLDPGGIMLLVTPNLDSRLLEMHGPNWSHWRPAANCVMLGVTGMRRLARETDFRIVRHRTHTDPLPLVRTLQNAAGTASEPAAPELLRRAYRLTAWARTLWDWRRRGDVCWAMLRAT